MTNLVARVRETVREHPDATALSIAGTDTSYAEFWSLAGRFAGALRERGVGPGDRIALYLPNLPQFVVAFHGILRAGGIVVPIDPRYRARELKRVLGDSTAGAVVTTTDRVGEIEAIHEHTVLQFIVTADGPGEFSTGFSDFLAESPEVDYWSIADRGDDEVAVLPYTEGPTGEPTGVKLTHGNLSSNADAVAELSGIGPDDRVLAAVPLARSFGTTVAMNATVFGGGTVRPLVEWDPGRALSLIESEEMTVFHGVPAMYADLADHPDADDRELSSLRLAAAGGNGLPTDLLEDVEAQFDVTVYEGYGRTEAGPVTHANDPGRGRRVGSVGRPIDGVRAMVVDGEFEECDPVPEGPLDAGEDRAAATGEIVVAGPGVMAGYRDEAATEAAFTVTDDGEAGGDAGASGTRWFHTGDLGYRDEDGYYYVVGRRDDRIVTGGYDVAPREVETLLADHDGVADAAVVGVPDERRGETVAAYVVRTAGADVDAEAIRDYCLSNLAAYKHPRTVEFVDELPRTETGAIDRDALRERGPGTEPVAGAVAAGTERPTGQTESAAAATPEAGASEAGAGPDSDGDDGGDAGLRDLDGISERRAEALQEAGYGSVPDLRDASHDELAAIEGFGDALASRIKQQVDDGPAGGE